MSLKLNILGFYMFLDAMKFRISALLPLDNISSIVSKLVFLSSLFTSKWTSLATATTVPVLATLAG